MQGIHWQRPGYDALLPAFSCGEHLQQETKNRIQPNMVLYIVYKNRMVNLAGKKTSIMLQYMNRHLIYPGRETADNGERYYKE